MESLKGKTALVTGGGRGLGAEICRTLAEAGSRVVCADVREGLAQALAGDMQREGYPVWGLSLDVTRPGVVARAVRGIAADYGSLDIIVNNAATDITVPEEELTEDDWERIIATNLSGPLWMSRAAFPIMKKAGGGHIVNITSTAAKRAWPNASAYHASKWGLLGLSHALHTEGRPHNIKVTALVSGGMRTPFLLDRFPDIDTSNLQDPANVAEAVRFVLTQPAATVIPELMVLPMTETSWP